MTKQSDLAKIAAMARTAKIMNAVARLVVIRSIKRSARYYALYPSSLEGIAPGLSFLRPRGIINRLQIIEIESPVAERYFGFGGEVPAINRRGAMLYARYSRLIAHKSRKVVEAA